MEALKKICRLSSNSTPEAEEKPNQFSETGPPPILDNEVDLDMNMEVDFDMNVIADDLGLTRHPNEVTRQVYLSMKHKQIPDEVDDNVDDKVEDAGPEAKRKKNSKTSADRRQTKKKKRDANKLCIQKTAIKALVKEFITNGITVSAEAERILHTVGEQYLTQVFENAQVLSTLNGRKTVSLADLRGVLALACTSSIEKQAVLAKDAHFCTRISKEEVCTGPVKDEVGDEVEGQSVVEEVEKEGVEKRAHTN